MHRNPTKLLVPKSRVLALRLLCVHASTIHAHMQQHKNTTNEPFSFDAVDEIRTNPVSCTRNVAACPVGAPEFSFSFQPRAASLVALTPKFRDSVFLSLSLFLTRQARLDPLSRTVGRYRRALDTTEMMSRGYSSFGTATTWKALAPTARDMYVILGMRSTRRYACRSLGQLVEREAGGVSSTVRQRRALPFPPLFGACPSPPRAPRSFFFPRARPLSRSICRPDRPGPARVRPARSFAPPLPRAGVAARAQSAGRGIPNPAVWQL